MARAKDTAKVITTLEIGDENVDVSARVFGKSVSFAGTMKGAEYVADSLEALERKLKGALRLKRKPVEIHAVYAHGEAGNLIPAIITGIHSKSNNLLVKLERPYHRGTRWENEQMRTYATFYKVPTPEAAAKFKALKQEEGRIHKEIQEWETAHKINAYDMVQRARKEAENSTEAIPEGPEQDEAEFTEKED